MSFEQKYVELYDALYGAKNYDFEVEGVLEFCRRYQVSPQTIIDYGCGTGNHAIRFASRRLRVYGVDSNPHMLAVAREKAKSNDAVTFLHDSELAAIPEHSVDVCTLLFDVLSYMTENRQIDQFLSFVSSRLKPGGLFVFDFWYGPAVLSLRPVDRWKEFETDRVNVLRLTRPELDWTNSVVNVSHEMIVTEGNVIADRFEDRHAMRFFFKKEICYFLESHGLEALQFCTWQNLDTPPSNNDWSVLVASRLNP